MIQTPYPKIDDLLEMMGEVGLRLSEIEASKGAEELRSICKTYNVKQNIF